MSQGPEFEKVEQPFCLQLAHMGWKHVTGNAINATATGRSSFREVLLEKDLRRKLIELNPGPDGKPWLDTARLTTAISALTRLPGKSLLECNQQATHRLMEGVAVEGLPHWNQGRNQVIHYIDWDRPERNEFTVINQFRVDEPGGGEKAHIIPDLVLFVNGIPLAVVECKVPILEGAPSGATTSRQEIVSAVDQLRRYSNQRFRFEKDEGNEALFHTNQLLIATCFEEARVGSIGGNVRHYKEWKDTSPVPSSEVAEALGKAVLSSQERLVAGMLRPAHLLDIVRHFTLFKEDDRGKTLKAVCRYQQFRAVHKAITRLKHGAPSVGSGLQDHRGGIIWHTQGSGKSLTMVFLVRKMRSDPDLRAFKVVIVTDRTDLQKQLSATLLLTGEQPRVANRLKQLEPLLSNDTPDIIFAMVQKYQNPTEDDDGGAPAPGAASSAGKDHDVRDEDVRFPELNSSRNIVVLVDEAHRSHGSNALRGQFGSLHSNLRQALPNAALIGFTGTPILKGARKPTHEIFGPFIDKYTIRQSEADGSTVPIFYEGRTVKGAVDQAESLDQLFEDFFADHTAEELEALKARYATTGHVLESEKLIEAKAGNMLRHYISTVLPNGFKAQVVAFSRRAAVRYEGAFKVARDKLVQEIEAVAPTLLGLDAVARGKLDPEIRLRVDAHSRLEQIKSLKFEVVISGNKGDDPSWKTWYERTEIDERIRRFKRPLGKSESKDTSPLAFLIVKSMLLTGFDAPIEQALYLDRPIQGAELLQAIARVNRSGPDAKTQGFVVDYYGVANHLDRTLKKYYEAEDIAGALRPIKDDLPRLRDTHLVVTGLITSRGLQLTDKEACVSLLQDPKLRASFKVALKRFLRALDSVLPALQALDYVPDAERLIEIQAEVARRYRDGTLVAVDPEDGAKVAELLDRHLISKGIDPRIKPISILDPRFAAHVNAMGSDRARASEMEHAARHFIREHFGEDPSHFTALSKRLEEILKAFAEHWDKQVEALSRFLEALSAGRQQDGSGLDPERQAPFLAIIQQAAYGETTPPDDKLDSLCALTVELVEHLEQEVRRVDFWRNAHAQDVLRSEILRQLDESNLVPFAKQERLADQIMDIARRRRHLFEADRAKS